MSVTSGFFNSLNGDRKYNAEQMSAIFDGIINDGVFASIGTAFAVTADTEFQVTVGIGRAWFNSTWVYNDAILPIVLEQPEVLIDRIDAVVIEVDRTDAVRKGDVKVVKGTPSSSPVRPSLVKSEKVNQYPLAYILRKAGSASITQGNITSMVGTSECPFITGILEVLSIDTIVAQWGAQWNEWYDEQTTKNEEASQEMIDQWNRWFTIQTGISEDEMNYWMSDMKSDFFNWYQSLQLALEDNVATSLAASIVDLQENFNTLLQDHAIYDTLDDNDGGIILDNMGVPIEGKAVFSTSVDDELDNLQLAFDLHVKNFDNPHEVTPEQIGAAKAEHTHSFEDMTDVNPVSKGGTGGSTPEEARANLQAAAANHTHNYAGSTSSGGAANSANMLNPVSLTNQDLNGYREATNFYYAAGGNSCINKPSGIDNFGMFVMRTANGWYTQILYASNNELYIRNYNANSWSSWVKIPSGPITGSEIASGTITATQLGVNYAGSSSKGGAATSATKLSTKRNIAISGGVTGTATGFDGSANITIPVTSVNMAKATGTFPVAVRATNSTDYGTSRPRNIRASTTDLTAGTSTLSNGEIYLVYE